MPTWNQVRQHISKQKTIIASAIASYEGLMAKLREEGVPEDVLQGLAENTEQLAKAFPENTPVNEVDMSPPIPSPGIEPQYPEGKPEGVE